MQATKLEKESGREIVSLSQQMCRKHERMRARAYQPIKLYTHTNAKKISQHSHNHTHTCTHTLEHESSNNKVITQTYPVHNKLVRIINKQCASTKPETQDYTCITCIYVYCAQLRERQSKPLRCSKWSFARCTICFHVSRWWSQRNHHSAMPYVSKGNL